MWMEDIATKCPPGLSCNVQTIGQSHESRDMKIIKIGANSNGNSTKPGIWIDCGIHAREWISPATCVYTIYRMIDDFSRGYTRATAVLNQYDWYFLPSANPDGYEFTWDDDRMWRKTRSPNSGSSCMGTDPNRNWDYQWMVAGASSNPCSYTYAGTKAFSEAETTAMRDFINSVKPSLRAYVSIHSYSQLILLPYGVAPAIPADYNELERAAKAARDELGSMFGTVYRVGATPALLYDAAGTSADWAKFVGIKYAYTYELRDTGRYGFILPADQILATAKETYVSLQRLAEEMKA
ncbi:carboxypeptidase B-like [Lineus longissimus]|uniref:carboxypeptidase B-like n=1 Tax=Lineus longissimus TaxID=88925 RepID=UPI00315C9F6C